MPVEDEEAAVTEDTTKTSDPSKSKSASEKTSSGVEDAVPTLSSPTDNETPTTCSSSFPDLASTTEDGIETFPSTYVENGSASERFSQQGSCAEDSRVLEAGDASSMPSNTLDDISSLKTMEESTSPIQSEAEVVTESDIGNIDANLAPSSLKEPPEKNGEEEEENEDGWMDVIGSGDLMKKVIRKGKGINSRPQRGNVATINLTGRLENGEEVDVEQGKKIMVGDADVIQGLDLAIPLMELDEISEIIIKPRLGYGKLGREPDIPPHSTITYQVELMAVEDDPEPENMSFAERKKVGDAKRERGNFWYSRGEFSCALQCYRRALDFLDDSTTNFKSVTEEQRILAETWIKVSNNMAAAQLKIGAYEAALKSVENVLKVQPQNVKALFRKGKILASMGSTEEAVKTMKEALKLEPETKIIHQELSNLVAKQKSEVKSEREMYKRMLGQDKQPQQAKEKPSSSRFLKWGIFAGSITAAVLSIVAYRHFHGGVID